MNKEENGKIVESSKQERIVKTITEGTTKNPLVREPGDSVYQYMTTNRNVVTKVKTQDVKATHRQYVNKDGSKGKQTITLMQPDGPSQKD